MSGSVVSERLHVDGLVIQLVRLRDSLAVVTANDTTNLHWPTIEDATVAQVKAYVDDVLNRAKHHCGELGCSGWLDYA